MTPPEAGAVARPVPVGASRPWRERDWVMAAVRLARRRTALVGFRVVVVVVACALLAPVRTPFDPCAQDISQRLKGPGWHDPQGAVHLLGTDDLGRDILARIIYGS